MPVIVTSGAQGAKSTSVLWQQAAVATVALDAAAGYPSINTTDPATWSSWRPATSGSRITHVFGESKACDGVGISAHNMATSGTSFSVQYSNDGSSFTTLASYAPLTDDDIFMLLPLRTAIYWRINLSGPPANIGVIIFGKRLIFPQSPVDSYTPLHHARQYNKMFTESIKGQFLNNRVVSVGAETDVDLGFFERPWLENNIRPFESHYNQGGTFFYCGCPSQSPLDMGYCKAPSENAILNIEWTEADKMATLDFGIQSYVG